MAIVITSVDGLAVNGATAYRVTLPAGQSAPQRVQVLESPRRNAEPRYDALQHAGWRFPLRISGVAGAGVSAAELRRTIEQRFSPRVSGLRELQATWHDGTAVRLQIVIEALELLSDAGIVQSIQYLASAYAPYPVWEAVTATTSAADPASVTNAGNVPALPRVALTTSTSVTRRACTVTGAGAGAGLIATPVGFAVGDSGISSTNVFVFIEGELVPSAVANPGTTSSRVWALVGTASDGTTPTRVDLLYGLGVTNPLASALDAAGMDLAAGASPNTSWTWNDWDTLDNPARAGAWVPALTGTHSTASGATVAITSSTTASTVISLGSAGQYDTSADSLLLTLGGRRAGTSNALASLSRTTAGLDGVNARAYVRYRVAGSALWQDAWTTRANATVTTAIDLDNAVEIAVGLENDGATADPATLTISGTATLSVQGAPTVTVVAAETYDRYDGTYTIGSRSITLNNLAVPDGTLTIDARERTISSSASGPFYQLEVSSDSAIAFSDPDVWLALEPGSNTVSDGLGATDTVTHRDTFA